MTNVTPNCKADKSRSLIEMGLGFISSHVKICTQKIFLEKKMTLLTSTYMLKHFNSFNRQAHIFQAKGPQAGKRVNMLCFEWSEKWKWLCRVVCEEVLTGRAASPTRGRRKLCSYFSCVVVFRRTYSVLCGFLFTPKTRRFWTTSQNLEICCYHNHLHIPLTTIIFIYQFQPTLPPNLKNDKSLLI